MNIPSFADPIRKGALTYIINRSRDSIIGGTDYDEDWNEEQDPEDTQSILGRFEKFWYSIKAPSDRNTCRT